MLSCSNGKIPISHVFSTSNKGYSSTWVIDSSATNHMTYSTGSFISYQPCLSNKKIIVADGSLTIVASQGTTSLSLSLSFKKVLHVPNLAINFLSIRKIIKCLNYSVTFFLDLCIFQDLSTRWRLGKLESRMGYTCLEYKAIIVTLFLYPSF